MFYFDLIVKEYRQSYVERLTGRKRKFMYLKLQISIQRAALTECPLFIPTIPYSDLKFHASRIVNPPRPLKPLSPPNPHLHIRHRLNHAR